MIMNYLPFFLRETLVILSLFICSIVVCEKLYLSSNTISSGQIVFSVYVSLFLYSQISIIKQMGDLQSTQLKLKERLRQFELQHARFLMR